MVTLRVWGSIAVGIWGSKSVNPAGVDGLLYLETHAGNFRVRGDQLEPAAYLPPPLPPFYAAGNVTVPFRDPLPMPDGSIAMWDDGDDGAGTFHRIRLASTNPTVATRVLPLDWQGGGSNLFVLHRGLDGNLYGWWAAKSTSSRTFSRPGSAGRPLPRATHSG